MNHDDVKQMQADLEGRNARLLEEGKKGWAAADRARAVMAEEAARWCDERASEHEAISLGSEVDTYRGLAHAGGMAAMRGAAEHFRAIAPLPPTLAAVPRDLLKRVAVSLDDFPPLDRDGRVDRDEAKVRRELVDAIEALT